MCGMNGCMCGVICVYVCTHTTLARVRYTHGEKHTQIQGEPFLIKTPPTCFFLVLFGLAEWSSSILGVSTTQHLEFSENCPKNTNIDCQVVTHTYIPILTVRWSHTHTYIHTICMHMTINTLMLVSYKVPCSLQKQSFHGP